MLHGAWILLLGGATRSSVPALIASAGPFAKALLLVLLAVSVYSWAVIWSRLRLYARVEREDRKFLGAFRRLRSLDLRHLEFVRWLVKTGKLTDQLA